MHTADDAFVLAIPEAKELADSKQYARFLHEKLRIEINELDEYELTITSTETEKRLGTYRTLQEAFASADEVVLRCRSSRAKLITRDAEWHKYPASEAAKKYLRKLTKKKPLLKCLCEGLHRPGVCPRCGKEAGITAGQAALALNILKTK
jgi:rubrerythrin